MNSKEDYDDFYKGLIEIWKCGGPNGTEGGWASCYYGVFSNIIKEIKQLTVYIF